MKLNKTETLILSALNPSYGPQPVSEIYRALPTGLFTTRNALSARLCAMRKQGLLHSVTLDSGINEWQATDAGLQMLPDVIGPDISAVPEPAISEPIQPDSPDISPDMAAPRPDPIAVDFAAAIEAAEEVQGAELRFFPESDDRPRPPWRGCSDEAAPGEVRDALVEEANTLRLRDRLPRLQNALYVLSVLIDRMGRDYPGIAYELTRIAAYIEDAP